MRTPKNIYRHFIEFEEKAAAIYLRLASRFSPENPELSALWLEMAMQEKQHAALLQFCRAEGTFAPELPADAEIQKFNGLFRKLEKRASAATIDINEAFELAWELEGSEVNTVYCYLTMPLNQSLYMLRRKIACSPTDHIERLIVAGRKFGISSATLKKLNRLTESCPTDCF